MESLRIGIDFDNTIVCYDNVFYKAANSRLPLPNDIGYSKDAIRDYLRSIGQESLWIELQGCVYGSLMHQAAPFPGVDLFFQSCKISHIETCIISHKTLHPFKGPQYDLHKAARSWLNSRPCFQNTSIYFELTLKEKLSRILEARCESFIDDLPELLLEPDFPQHVQKILFDPLNRHPSHPSYLKFSSWTELCHFFGISNG